MADRIDSSPYTAQLQGDATFLLGLGLKLHLARPHKLDDAAHEAADALDQSTHALQKEWNASKKANSGALVLADQRIDTAWGAFHARLEAYTVLPAEKYPRVPESIALFSKLFAQGKAFLGFKYVEEWAESERLLKLIESENLTAAVVEFVGQPFLANVKEAHAAYGAVQGLTASKPVEAKLHLNDRVKETRLALADYALALVVMANRKNADRADIAPSLQLFDEARAELARGRAAPAKDEPVDPAKVAPAPATPAKVEAPKP